MKSLVLLLSILTASQASATTLVLKHATVVDVKAGVLRHDVSIIVQGTSIEAVGKDLAVPRGAQSIDLKGKFVIPGLWDMHVHVLSFKTVSLFFPMLIANGVTGIRDTGTTEEGFAKLRPLRQQIANGQVVGPHIIAAGRILDGPEPTVPENSIPFKDEASARQVVRFMHENGADFVKIYDRMTPAIYYAILNEAKKLGFYAAGHIPTDVTALEASNAGQRSFEHLGNILRSCSRLSGSDIEAQANAAVGAIAKGDLTVFPKRIAARTKIELDSYDAGKCQALFTALARNKTYQVPTLVTKRAITNPEELASKPDARQRFIPPSELEDWKPENNLLFKYRTPEYIKMRSLLYAKELQLVREMHRSGVPFMTGTDIPGAYTYAGFSVHDEMQLLVECGFSPLDALRAATTNPATFLGKENELGQIKKGFAADMVILDADPLVDVRNTTKIFAVIAQGKHYDRAFLDQMLAKAQSAAGH